MENIFKRYSELIGNAKYGFGTNIKTNSETVARTNIKTNSETVAPIVITSTSWKKIIAYTLSVLIIIGIIVIFVHYTIMPVFKFKPGDPGIIRVPGYDDGVLYWTSNDPEPINNNLTIVSDIYQNYSYTLDITIIDPLRFASTPRIIFHRGTPINKNIELKSDKIVEYISNYNTAIALAPDTNDIYVYVLKSDNNSEKIVLQNAPVQQSFRLGVIIMEKAVEVYINGNLMKTVALSAPPMAILGNFYPSEGTSNIVAKIKNLHIWPRIVDSAEIRESEPPLKPFVADLFGFTKNANQCESK